MVRHSLATPWTSIFSNQPLAQHFQTRRRKILMQLMMMNVRIHSIFSNQTLAKEALFETRLTRLIQLEISQNQLLPHQILLSFGSLWWLDNRHNTAIHYLMSKLGKGQQALPRWEWRWIWGAVRVHNSKWNFQKPPWEKTRCFSDLQISTRQNLSFPLVSNLGSLVTVVIIIHKFFFLKYKSFCLCSHSCSTLTRGFLSYNPNLCFLPLCLLLLLNDFLLSYFLRGDILHIVEGWLLIRCIHVPTTSNEKAFQQICTSPLHITKQPQLCRNIV